MFNDKKNLSAKKKSAYSSKIHDFIDKLLDSPTREFKENTDKCNTNPKKEESKTDNFLLQGSSNIKGSLKSDSTLLSLEKNIKREKSEIDKFDESEDIFPCDQSVEDNEKISFEKSFFEECLLKGKVKLSEIVRKDYKEVLEGRIQKIMKEAMDDKY